MMDPFGDFEEAFNRLPATMGGAQSFVPAMDVYETDKAVMVETPLAGVKPEDVEISVSNGILTVKGENKKEHEVDDKNYYRKEVRSGSFHREVMLPSAIEEEKVTAEFENGILKISCPKAAAPKAKKINVKIVKHKK
jgi:HSP20 family protein